MNASFKIAKKKKKKHVEHSNGFWQKFIPFSPILYYY